MLRSVTRQFGFRHRGTRVLAILMAVILLSTGDMVLTAHQLRTIGMAEANPLAAMLITSTSSIWPLIIYKLATVALSVGMLYRIRRRLQAEIGAWICFVVMLALTAHWLRYTDAVIQPEITGALVDGNVDDSWLSVAKE